MDVLYVCRSYITAPTPPPQADSDNIDSMSLYLLLCWGLIQQKNRQRQKKKEKPETGWSKGVKERASFSVEYRCVSLKILTNVGHQMRLNFPFHRTGERRATFTDGQPRQTYLAHSYLPRANSSSSACRGAPRGATMFSSSPEPLLGQCFPLKGCFCGAAS